MRDFLFAVSNDSTKSQLFILALILIVAAVEVIVARVSHDVYITVAAFFLQFGGVLLLLLWGDTSD